MAAIPTIDRIAAKWAQVTPQRTEQYREGVTNPLRDWAQGAAGANDAWKAGVADAVTKDLFKKGVSRAGTASWQKGAIEKGVPRFGPGVQISQDKFATAFAPFREAIARVVLPPRGPRRDPRNLERVRLITQALAKAKLAQAGNSSGG